MCLNLLILNLGEFWDGKVIREYKDYIIPDEKSEEYRLVKAADKISALIKCIEEKNAGNNEFGKALESTKKSLENMNMPEVDAFIEEFLPSFYLSLDEQNEASF